LIFKKLGMITLLTFFVSLSSVFVKSDTTFNELDNYNIFKQVSGSSGGGGVGIGDGSNESNLTISNTTDLETIPAFNFNEFMKHPLEDIFKNKYGTNMTFLLTSLILLPIASLLIYIKSKSRPQFYIRAKDIKRKLGIRK